MSSQKNKSTKKPIPKEVTELEAFLHAYEKLCTNTKTQVNPWIKDNAKLYIDRCEILTKIILDFSNVKSSPPVLFTVIIAALRQTRYKYIKHIYVWNYPMSYENIVVLANYMENPSYNTHTLHLMDCMLTPFYIERLSREIPSNKCLSEICLDYNDIGDLGCEYLAQSLQKNVAIKCLRLNFCGLSSKSGKFLHEIIVNSTISDLYVGGNDLQCSGILEMLQSCADQAVLETKQGETAESTKEDKKKTNDKKGKGKKSRKRNKSPLEPIIRVGPWIEKLDITDNGVDIHSLEGTAATLNCVRMITTLIMNSVCLKELDLTGNEIGNLASLMLLQAMEARITKSFPPMKLKSTAIIQMPGIYEPLVKISSGKGPKKKRKKIKKKK